MMIASPAKAKFNLWQSASLRVPLLAWLSSRLLIAAVMLLSLQLNPKRHWLEVFTQWDSNFYLEIAREGYIWTLGQASSVAFFPLYPTLMALLHVLIPDLLVCGLLLSFSFFLAALIVLHKLCVHEFGEVVANRAVWLLAFFPSSLFYGAIYTESLFLFLTLSAFYFARTRQWAWAGLIGLLASSTRINGAIILVPLVIQYLVDVFQTPKKTRASLGLWLLLVPLGLISHMVFLERHFSDPTAFWTVQSTFGRMGWNPLGAISRDLAPVIAGHWQRAWNVPVDLSALVLALVTGIIALRSLGVAYGIWALLGVLIPLLSGTGSLLRYVCVLFPVFMVLAIKLNGFTLKFVNLLFIVLLIVVSYFFALGVFIG
jgi:Mannosyltransferase (PIG-V)